MGLVEGLGMLNAALMAFYSCIYFKNLYKHSFFRVVPRGLNGYVLSNVCHNSISDSLSN